MARDFRPTTLLTGASGQFGSYLLQQAQEAGLPLVAWSGRAHPPRFGFDLRPVPLAEPAAVTKAYRATPCPTVLHVAALSRIDQCAAQPDVAERVNVEGTRALANLARDHGARLVYVSTDLVFDGRQGHYRETDRPQPLSCYGRSKLAAERLVAELPGSLIVRISLLFGPSLTAQPSYFDRQIAALRAHEHLALYVDEWRTPLSLRTAAAALWQLATSDVTGVLHLGGPERLTRWEMGQRLAARLGTGAGGLVPARQPTNGAEPRPRDVSLNSSRWRALFPRSAWPAYEDALNEFGLVSSSRAHHHVPRDHHGV